MTAQAPSSVPPSDPVEEMLRKSGLALLAEEASEGRVPSAERLESALVSLAELAKPLAKIRRAVLRERAISVLSKAGSGSPAKLYDAAVEPHSGTESSGFLAGTELSFPDDDDELWPSLVDGAALVGELATTFGRYAVLPAGAATALALWSLHTHTIEAANFAPRLALISPVKRCGKTLVLAILEAITRKPLSTANVTPAVLFRVVEKARPTLLVDEADSFLSERDELRGILNAGFSHDGRVLRCVGDDAEPRAFRCFGALGIAAIGRLPGTIEDRSILINMKRKTSAETVQRFRRPERNALVDLRRRCARWAADNLSDLRLAQPTSPPELNDRASDKWEPLLAIADRLGDRWPLLARKAALILSGERADSETEDMGVELLRDVRLVLRKDDGDRIASEELLGRLVGLEGRPWSEIDRGRPMTTNVLARMLAPFGAKPKAMRLGDGSLKRGYELSTFEDAFNRYLPKTPVTGETSLDSFGGSSNGQVQRENSVAPAPRPTSPRDHEDVAPVTDDNLKDTRGHAS